MCAISLHFVKMRDDCSQYGIQPRPQGLCLKKWEAWYGIWILRVGRCLLSNRNELSRKRGKVSRPCCPRLWSYFHEGAPLRTLLYTRRSHRDPPLGPTLPAGSSPTPGAPTEILPWTQGSHQDPLGLTIPPGSSPRPGAPPESSPRPGSPTRILSLYQELTRFPT